MNSLAQNTANRISHVESDPSQEDKRLNIQVDALQAELNSRAEILNQTSLLTITDLQGTIIYANDLFCQVSGFGRHQLIGRDHKLIRHPLIPKETIESIWRTIRSGNTWKGEMKHVNKSGEDFWTMTTVAPVKGEDGEPVRYIWVRHDITHLKKTETRLLEARQRADQQLIDNVMNASTVQRAILSQEEELQQLFPASFVFFSPKHAVSGDFYWFRRVGDESVVVLGDGTGHGVSAAFVSLMALSALKYAVDIVQVTEPALVMSQLNHFLYRALNKHKESGLSESVDLSFCRYNHKTGAFSYATARSKIYLVRDGQVEVLSSGHDSIGSKPELDDVFTPEEIQLRVGDRIFMTSDGLADQFGGERNKRFGSRQLRELLQITSRAPMSLQKEVIHKNYLLWRGENEQTDDQSLVAFEIG